MPGGYSPLTGLSAQLGRFSVSGPAVKGVRSGPVRPGGQVSRRPHSASLWTGLTVRVSVTSERGESQLSGPWAAVLSPVRSAGVTLLCRTQPWCRTPSACPRSLHVAVPLWRKVPRAWIRGRFGAAVLLLPCRVSGLLWVDSQSGVPVPGLPRVQAGRPVLASWHPHCGGAGAWGSPRPRPAGLGPSFPTTPAGVEAMW